MVHGKTPVEAVANAQDVIGLWIDIAKEFGHPVPELTAGDKCMREPHFAPNRGIELTGACFVLSGG